MNQSTSKKEESNKEKESDAIHSISEILQTGLNKRTIAVLTDLIELGIEPESLVDGKPGRLNVHCLSSFRFHHQTSCMLTICQRISVIQEVRKSGASK